MAGESCNLNKDEAEILKPSSTSSPPSHPSPSPPPPPPATAPPSSLFLKPPLPQEFPAPERPVRSPEAAPPLAAVSVDAAASALQQNSEQEPHSLEKTAPAPVPFGKRCSSCGKRVGLIGFRCRCGDLFCPRHRHSDTHDCSFDYKTAGREQIAKANPLIRAAKIIKI